MKQSPKKPPLIPLGTSFYSPHFSFHLQRAGFPGGSHGELGSEGFSIANSGSRQDEVLQTQTLTAYPSVSIEPTWSRPKAFSISAIDDGGKLRSNEQSPASHRHAVGRPPGSRLQ